MSARVMPSLGKEVASTVYLATENQSHASTGERACVVRRHVGFYLFLGNDPVYSATVIFGSQYIRQNDTDRFTGHTCIHH